jgi:hypothetical protein
LLRSRGHHAARILADRLEQSLRQAATFASGDDEDDDIESGESR